MEPPHQPRRRRCGGGCPEISQDDGDIDEERPSFRAANQTIGSNQHDHLQGYSRVPMGENSQRDNASISS
eukprot:3806254-Karenia_brevis.AAC.1